MLRADIIRASAIGPLETAQWRAMALATPGFANPLLGPEFARAVGAVREDAWVAVLKRDNRTAGFLPFHRAGRGYARPIGAPFSDYHSLVTEPSAPLGLQEALRAAGLNRFRFGAAVDPHGTFAGMACSNRLAYPIDLGALGPEGYLEALRVRNPKHSKRWRQLACKLGREIGPLELVFGEPSVEAFDRAVAWKRAQLRRTGMFDVLRPSWVRDLMDELFARQGQDFGGLHIALWAGGRHVASSFGVRSGRAFHSWIAAFDPALGEYGPGRVLHFKGIEAMAKAGLDLWDLGPDHGDWKRRFVLEPITVFEGVAEARPLRLRLPSPSHFAPAPLAAVLGKVAGRLEHIAAAEPTASGRLNGVLDALVHGHRRLSLPGAVAEA